MTLRRKTATKLRQRGHRRIADVIHHHGSPWWDWGHPLMAIVGSDFGGSWDQPKPPTWWYRRTQGKPMRRTRYPRSKAEVLTGWDEMRAATEGLDEDAMYEWRAINMSSDGEIQFGHQYWGGSFHGLAYWEAPVVLRWMIRWQLTNWFGLRTWLWHQALHAAVHQRKPFACNQTPARGSGGYGHWHCTERRHHTGPHRFRSMTWTGEGPVTNNAKEANR